jgi:hypothetical protein
MPPVLKEQLRAHYLSTNPPSVFEQYGSLSSAPSAVEPIQFLFSWQALGADAKSDAKQYLRALLAVGPKDLDAFLKLMFRVNFIDDYETLKALIDYPELAELIRKFESSLDPEKVRQFWRRQENDRASGTNET